MLKKIPLLLLLLIFISSCSEVENINKSGLNLIETDSLSIKVPENWNIINNTDSVLPKIKNGKIELVVSSENMVNGFVNNLLILSENLEKYISSKDFSILNHIGSESDYMNYLNIESKEFTFLNQEKSMLYVFEAKYNVDTPKLKFLQTAIVCNQKKAFFFTIAIPITIKDTKKYEYLLSTFNCK